MNLEYSKQSLPFISVYKYCLSYMRHKSYKLNATLGTNLLYLCEDKCMFVSTSREIKICEAF